MGANTIEIVNQQPNALLDHSVPRIALPLLLKATKCIEDATGHRWKVTSYIRESPSHKTGWALDIAPDISKKSERYYAVTRLSDPVLYKRVPLIRFLQQVVRNTSFRPYVLGVFIEPDHLHMQLFRSTYSLPENMLFKWKQPKPVYSDTAQRMLLPLIY